jgi:hypothetical protein
MSQGTAELANRDDGTGEELIKAMQRARKLGLKLRPARVPALVRPPLDVSDESR